MSELFKRLGRQSPSTQLTVFGIALVVAIVAVTAVGVWRLRAEALLDAERGLASLNHALVEQTAGSIGNIDRVLMSTAEWVQGMTRARASNEESMHQQLHARISGVPQIKSLAVFRADGSLQFSSLYYPAPALNNYDDPYFAAHRDSPSSGLYVAVPRQSKLDGEWYLFFSRAIRGPGGRLDGVLMALVDPDYFVDSYRRLKLAEGGSVALARADGAMLAIYPGQAQWLGKSLGQSELYTQMLAKGGHAVMQMPGVIDGIPRIVSGEMVQNYPLRMHVTVTEEAALKEWRRSASPLTAAATGTTLLIVLLIGGLRRQLKRQEALGHNLRESEARFRSLVELSSDWYWEQDQNYRFVYRHGAVLDEKGVPPADDYGKTRWELDFPDMTEADWAAHRALLERREEFRDLLLGRRSPDGTIFWATISGRPVFDEQRNFCGYRGVGRDVTGQKKAEAALHQLNAELEQRVRERTAKVEAANKELETFTYSVAHDLKAPLRGIDGYSQLLLEEYSDKLDDEGRRYLRNVRQAAQQMGQLISDLLAYSRLERRDMQTSKVDPQALVEALLAERAEEIKARGAAVNASVYCSAVTADRDGLAMALRNLLENALKFSRDAPNPTIEISGHDAGNACILSVRDNGTGFDMKYHDRIFDIFQRLHRSEDYPGTGIGLAIVKKAMERIGGRTWAESEPGKGATFYLEIPK